MVFSAAGRGGWTGNFGGAIYKGGVVSFFYQEDAVFESNETGGVRHPQRR